MTPNRGNVRVPSNHTASIEAWDTRDPEPPGFAAAWQRALSGSSHAHFGLNLEYLRWESGRGRRMRAILVQTEERSGAIVQRRETRRWVSGWPWRWQAVVRPSDPHSPLGMTAEEAAWLHEHVVRFSGRERVLHFLPHVPPGRVPGWSAGSTIVQSIQHSDDELYEGLEPSKRRQLNRGRRSNVEIDVARSPGDFRAFHTLQQDAPRRGRSNAGRDPAAAPEPAEPWREWELPWMWLLLARRGGEVIAGVGDGVHPGGAMQGRTAAATLEARRSGATVLLGYEELRRGRDLGHRWFNYGGDTPFKREMSGRLGRRVGVYGWLGGGRAAAWWHFGEAALRQVRPTLAHWRRRAGLVRVLAVVLAHLAVRLAGFGADLSPGF